MSLTGMLVGNAHPTISHYDIALLVWWWVERSRNPPDDRLRISVSQNCLLSVPFTLNILTCIN